MSDNDENHFRLQYLRRVETHQHNRKQALSLPKPISGQDKDTLSDTPSLNQNLLTKDRTQPNIENLLKAFKL